MVGLRITAGESDEAGEDEKRKAYPDTPNQHEWSRRYEVCS
jgi:hypothetical protein